MKKNDSKNYNGIVLFGIITCFVLGLIFNLICCWQLSYADFKSSLANHEIIKVYISKDHITGKYRRPFGSSGPGVFRFKTRNIADPQLEAELDSYGIPHKMENKLDTILDLFTMPWFLEMFFVILCVAFFASNRKKHKKTSSENTKNQEQLAPAQENTVNTERGRMINMKYRIFISFITIVVWFCFILTYRPNQTIHMPYGSFKMILARGDVIDAKISKYYITGKYQERTILPNSVRDFKTARIVDPQLEAELDRCSVPHKRVISIDTISGLFQMRWPIIFNILLLVVICLSIIVAKAKKSNQAVSGNTNEQAANARENAAIEKMDFQVDTTQEGLQQDPLNDNLKPAGFWIRGLALSIDCAVLSGILSALRMLSRASYQAEMAGGAVFALLYFTYYHGTYGATPGKLSLGIKVVNNEGGAIGYDKAFFRALSALVDFPLTLGIGYLIAAFSENKKTIHDYICSTKVVRRPLKKSQLAYWMVILAICLGVTLYMLFYLFHFFSVMRKFNAELRSMKVVQSNILKGNLNVNVEGHLPGNVAADNAVLISSAQSQAPVWLQGDVSTNNVVLQNNVQPQVQAGLNNSAAVKNGISKAGNNTLVWDNSKDKIIEDMVHKIVLGMQKVLSNRGWVASGYYVTFTPPVSKQESRSTTHINIFSTTRYCQGKNDFKSIMEDQAIRSGYDIINPLFSLPDWGVFAAHKLTYGMKNENGRLVKVNTESPEEVDYFFQKKGWPLQQSIQLTYTAASHELFEKYRKDFEAAVMSVKETLENDSGYAR